MEVILLIFPSPFFALNYDEVFAAKEASSVDIERFACMLLFVSVEKVLSYY